MATDEELEQYDRDCTSENEVAEYLAAAYDMDPADITQALDDHADLVEIGIRVGSHVSYIGDEVAKAQAEA